MLNKKYFINFAFNFISKTKKQNMKTKTAKTIRKSPAKKGVGSKFTGSSRKEKVEKPKNFKDFIVEVKKELDNYENIGHSSLFVLVTNQISENENNLEAEQAILHCGGKSDLMLAFSHLFKQKPALKEMLFEAIILG